MCVPGGETPNSGPISPKSEHRALSPNDALKSVTRNLVELPIGPDPLTKPIRNLLNHPQRNAPRSESSEDEFGTALQEQSRGRKGSKTTSPRPRVLWFRVYLKLPKPTIL